MNAKVLVIDDMEGIASLFKRFLSLQGYDVSTACSYYEAMEKIAALDFDLVLTDIDIGDGKTGIDVLKEVKLKNSTCPVILCTGNPDAMTESESKRIGAYDCMYKPVDLESLLHCIHKALSFS
jgi:two-component system phosphate regulon response regulator OmpR